MADWLLAQQPGEPADRPQDPTEPDAKTLVALARVYLAKAPGMTAANVDEVLPKDAVELALPALGASTAVSWVRPWTGASSRRFRT